MNGTGWTKVEKRKAKKNQKSKTKSDMTQPRFMYNNAEINKRSHAVNIDDVRDLVLHVVADAPPPNWLRVDNAHLMQKVVAVLIPGLTPDILSLPPLPTAATSNPNLPISIPLFNKAQNTDSTAANIPFIASTFTHACPTRAPGDQTRMHSVLSTFFNGPISGEEKKRRIAQRLNSESSKQNSPSHYTLSLEQMIENDYPVPSYMADVFQKPSGWVETPQPMELTDEQKKSAPKQRVYAIDCEMCVTEDGKDLTHICVIDYYTGLVVYDQLVKPASPITDYLTRWSGITAEALVGVTTTHAQVQAHILKLLSPPTPNPFSTSTNDSPPPTLTPILLGHSLESDLKALKICHPLCIDTAVIYHHPRGRPLKPGLAWLTKKWCGREIQTRGEGGHDPEEDARACLDLLKKKIEGGPGFGEFKVDFESIFERMSRSTRRAGGAAGSIKSAVVDHGNPGVMHGSKASTAVGCTSDEEVVQKLLDVIPSHHFTFARLMNLANIQGWTTPKSTSSDTAPPPPQPAPSPETLNETLQSLNSHLTTIHANLPPRTALIIFTGHSDPRKMAALNARKSQFETALRSGKAPEDLSADIKWSNQDGRDLEEAVELARRGLLFLGVKY